MSKKVNPTSIGLFIVTGLALGVAALLLFGSSKLFTRSREVIVYFDQSLNGLNEGAPVKYRGVTIGFVKRVMVRYNQATHDYAMPVILELQEHLIRQRLGEPGDVFADQPLELRVRNGLRASLQAESLVTGVLYVDIRIHADALPPVFHQLKKAYPELPSESTQIQRLFNDLAALDLRLISRNLNALLTKLYDTIDQLQVGQINQGITNILLSMDRLVSSPEITNDLVAVRTALDQYRALGEKLNRRIDPLADSITNSLAEANRALAQFRGASENVRTLLAPDSAVPIGLDQALEQLAGAAQSISVLVDFLKQHPNALLTGRQIPKKKP